jgi:hypothetical protein
VTEAILTRIRNHDPIKNLSGQRWVPKMQICTGYAWKMGKATFRHCGRACAGVPFQLKPRVSVVGASLNIS